jgi:hypothetical protein
LISSYGWLAAGKALEAVSGRKRGSKRTISPGAGRSIRKMHYII